MRAAGFAIAIFLCCSSSFAQTLPASDAYLHRVSSIILSTLGPQLQKHPERLTGLVKVALRIDKEGHIHVQKVLSTSPNRWMQETTMRVLDAVKLPPMPKEVVSEQRHEWIDFQADWSFVPNQ
jgi:Gram-negative bacterial TonB protein C-terminal